jgi:hypothetical protein
MNTRNDLLIEKYLAPKKCKKINEASGAGTSYESMWNQWWSRPYLILIRDELILHSTDPMYPTGSTMPEDDRKKASMKGYTILDW